MILLGLGKGHLYFLLCGSTGVTAQTNAIDLRDRPHNTQSAPVATRTAGVTQDNVHFHKAFDGQLTAERRSKWTFPRDIFRTYSK